MGGAGTGGGSRKDWMTDEGTFGELKGGTVIRISLGLARQLLHPQNVVLEALGGYGEGMPFEIAVGVNGMLWVHSSRPEHTVLICNAVKNSEILTSDQIRGMVASLVQTVSMNSKDD